MKRFFLAVLIVAVASFSLSPLALAAPKANIEDKNNPEVNPTGPIYRQAAPTQTTAPRAAASLAVTATSTPANLIANPSFETVDSSLSKPANWKSDHWGNNIASFSYPAAKSRTGKAVSVTIASTTGGDAKWYFDDVPVTSGHTYQFSDYSLSSSPSKVDVRYTMNDGTMLYKFLTDIPVSADFQQNIITFTVPANVASLTIFHLLENASTLNVDDYSLIDTSIIPPPPPPPSSNLISNGDLETTGSAGAPLNWKSNKWGTNIVTFSYPVAGVSGSKAAKVTVTSYTSGDAKWYFNPITVPPGTYTFADQYISDKPTVIDIQFHNKDGSFTYKDIAFLPAAGTFTPASVQFTVPSTVQDITIFHLIQSVGSLTIDNAELTAAAAPSGIFTTGAVTFRFDDGWNSQYKTALPKLSSYGFKSTFYIVSQQILDNGYSGFMSKAQIQDLYSQGNEIGDHTRTHPHLTRLTTTQEQDEIVGARQDLQAMGISSVTTFAYPYGEYNATTIDIVKNAGLSAAAATLNGLVTPTSDRYQLERRGVESTVTVAQMKQWVDDAFANKQWLILELHRVDTSGDQYSITPDNFSQLVDYVSQKKIPVVTISQGTASLNP
jgi:peptidoglycan/xylan/chitin deacetylase (PgdA/CDA1 family)